MFSFGGGGGGAYGFGFGGFDVHTPIFGVNFQTELKLNSGFGDQLFMNFNMSRCPRAIHVTSFFFN